MRITDESGVWEVNGDVRILIEPSQTWKNKNQPIVDPQIVSEPVDEEKVWMAEAIIQQSAEIEGLKARIQTLEGGS